ACCAISASQRGQLPDPQRPGGQHPAAHVAAGGIREPHWHPSAWELNTVEWGSVFGAGTKALLARQTAGVSAGKLVRRDREVREAPATRTTTTAANPPCPTRPARRRQRYPLRW